MHTFVERHAVSKTIIDPSSDQTRFTIPEKVNYKKIHRKSVTTVLLPWYYSYKHLYTDVSVQSKEYFVCAI